MERQAAAGPPATRSRFLCGHIGRAGDPVLIVALVAFYGPVAWFLYHWDKEAHR